MDKARIESRRKDFKKNFEDPRRRREDEAVQIRKAMREQQVSQKRAQLLQSSAPASTLSIPDAYQYAISDDPEKQLMATQQFRRLLAVDMNPPIQEVIDTGIVPRLVGFLRDESRPSLQLEAAWTLTNIASGSQDQTRVVTDHGAIPVFVELLSSPREEVTDQAVWALANIGGDCPACRDMVLQAGALEPLLQQIKVNKKTNMLRNAAWALSNLCRGNPAPDFSLVRPALPTLRQLIYSSDVEVLTDATWALTYLLDTKDLSRIDEIINPPTCYRLVRLLTHPNALVNNPALRSIGQIIAGTHDQTDVVIQAGVLQPMLSLLSSPKVPIKKEAAWVLSNIAAGTTTQIQALIAGGVIDPLIQVMATAEMEVRRECAWALCNAIIGGNGGQIEYIVSRGCVKPLCDLLVVKDKAVKLIALEAIDGILNVGKRIKEEKGLAENPYVVLVEEGDGCSKLEQLQLTDPTGDIFRTVIRIMTSYFQTEMDFEEDDQPVEMAGNEQAPAGSEMGGFGVNVPSGGFNFAAAPQS